jgi:hypothetical protein
VTTGIYEGETALFFMIAQNKDYRIRKLLEETPGM